MQKIIDEKGRLFGKINIIDFLVLMFLFCFIPMVYFGYKILSRAPVNISEAVVINKDMELPALIQDLDEKTLEQIAAGDKELDDSGNLIAQILNLGKTENMSIQANFADREPIIIERFDKKQVYVTMKLICQIRGDRKFYFKGKELKYEEPFTFRTDKYQVTAMLVDILKNANAAEPFQQKWISLQLKLANVSPEIFRIIQKNDVNKNTAGEIIAKVSSVSSKSSKILVAKEDKVVVLEHPFDKDILLTLDIQCTQKDGVYYYANCPIKIGNSLTFNTDLYSLSGIIVGLEER